MAFLIVLLPTQTPAQAGDGRIYVRRIEFLGTNNVDDTVLRRELTQLEGAHINTTALEQSRIRLEQLPFVEAARVEQRPVTGVPDQVDVLITITEAPARRYALGGAYSESSRLSGYGFFIDENLFGTGQRLFAQAEGSEFHRGFQLAHTNHFVRADGISQTIAISSRRFDQLTADTTELEGDLLRAYLGYSYRIAERQSVRFGFTLQDAELTTGLFASTQLEDWVRNNGNPSVQGNVSSTDYVLAEFLFDWHHETLDKKVFPTAGMEQQLSLKSTVPGSEVEYYTIEYELSKYWPLPRGWTASIRANLGYGAKYGSKTSSLPPNLNWFAGGPGTVRGYRENRLGPRDSLGNPYGGNLFLSSQFELMMPLPEKWRKHARVGLFYDMGNVFSTEGIDFRDDDGEPLDYSFSFSEIRHSAGLSAQIRIPIGLLKLSYGVPLNAKDNDPNRFIRDDIKRFQIAVGVEF